MPYCPVCRGEFVEGTTDCPDCAVALVPTPSEEASAPAAEGSVEVWPVVLESGDPAVLGAARSALESVGVPFVVENEGLQHLLGPGTIGTGYSMVFGPARLRVPPERAAEAQALLARGAEPAPDDEASPSAAPETAPYPPPLAALESAQPGASWAPAGGFALGLAVGLVMGVLGVLLLRSPLESGEGADERPHGTFERDEDGDGRTDAVHRYEDGVLRAVSEDRDRDGKVDRWSEFDGQGRQVGMRWDENFDGRPDSWYEYDKRGLLIAERTDNNFDGVPDARYRFRYAGSALAEGTLDTDFDGTTDLTIIYRHSRRHEATWEVRPGAPARKLVYRHGLLTEELRDRDGDGQYDLRIRYGPFENLVDETELR